MYVAIVDCKIAITCSFHAAPGAGGGGVGAPGSPSPALPDIPVDLPFALPFDIVLPQPGSVSPTRIVIIAASAVAALLAAVTAAGTVYVWRTMQHKKRVAAEAAARRPSRASQQVVGSANGTPGGSRRPSQGGPADARRPSQMPLVQYPDVLHSLGPPPPLPTTPFARHP